MDNIGTASPEKSHLKKLPPLKFSSLNSDQQLRLDNQKKEMKLNETFQNSKLEVQQQRANFIDKKQEASLLNQPAANFQGKYICFIVSIVLMISSFMALIITVSYLAPIQTTVVIVGTNDLHGKVFPTPLFRPDTKQAYKYGGLTYLISLMKIVSDQNQNNMLYLDAGDQFQGGIESSKLVSSGQIMNDFYKRAQLKASTIGNHQFDFGPQYLLNYLKGRQTPNLMANLRSDKGVPDFLPNHKSSDIYQFQRGIKVGLIGLITTQTPFTTSAFTSGKFPSYQFLNYSDVVINKSKELRQKGVHAVVLVTHLGNSCTNDFKYGIWTSQNSQNPCQSDQLSMLIDSLPEGTIDGVVQGHRHRIAHYYHKGIPFMGAIGILHKFYLINTSIEGPVPVCQKIFQNTKRCDYVQGTALSNAGKLINWKFHQKDVKADEQFQKILNQKWASKMALYQEFLINNQIALIPIKYKQYQLGNLFKNLLHELVPTADFTILNTGGFRSSWFPGVITYENYYNMFPFDNQIVSFTMTGAQLLQCLSIIQSNNQFFATWNLRNEVNVNNNTGVRTVTLSKFVNNTAIQPTTVYKGVTINFLLNGGDAFRNVINVTYTPNNVQTIGQFRSSLKPYLKAVGTIAAGQLINPLKPRLVIVYV